jgi:hypothetical protein
MRTVRKGATYRYAPKGVAHWVSGDLRLYPGELVRVVNLPGGSKGGVFRNVQSIKTGAIGFVRVDLTLEKR